MRKVALFALILGTYTAVGEAAPMSFSGPILQIAQLTLGNVPEIGSKNLDKNDVQKALGDDEQAEEYFVDLLNELLRRHSLASLIISRLQATEQAIENEKKRGAEVQLNLAARAALALPVAQIGSMVKGMAINRESEKLPKGLKEDAPFAQAKLLDGKFHIGFFKTIDDAKAGKAVHIISVDLTPDPKSKKIEKATVTHTTPKN